MNTLVYPTSSERTHHLKESQISIDDVIEIDPRIFPGEILAQTIQLVGHVLRQIDPIVRSHVDTFVEFPTEELNAHDREDQPEDETHEQNIEDGRNGADQCIDNDLERVSSRSVPFVSSRVRYHTRMPSNLDSAFNGRSARSVLMDLNAGISATPSQSRILPRTLTTTMMKSSQFHPLEK